MRRLFFIFIICSLSAAAYGAESILAQNFRFYNFCTRDGLSNNTVNDLLVDHQGFLWVASSMGLNRFDGYSVYTFYYYNNDREKPIVNVEEIQEDILGSLWLRNSSLLMRYDRKTNHFTEDHKTYLRALGYDIPKDANVRIKTTADDGMWVVVPGMIYYGNYKTGEKVRSWKANVKATESLEEHNDELYLCDANEIVHFSKHTGKYEKIRLPKEFNDDKGHLRIYIDHDGLLWLYSYISEDICYFPSSDGKLQRPFLLPKTGDSTTDSESNAIRDVYDDMHGRIWIATDHEGVYVFDKYNGEFRNLRHEEGNASSLVSNNVSCITSDDYGTVWLGHYNMGVSYFNQSYNIFSHIAVNRGDVSSLLYDSKGNLWIGTDGNGLVIQRPDGTFAETDLPRITISSLLEDRHGTVWVGTYKNGLYRMNDSKTVAVYNVENGALKDNCVWQMAEDGEGNIWHSSVFHKLAVFNPVSGKSKSYLSEHSEMIDATSVVSDDEGNVYCGTYTGLFLRSVKDGKGRIVHGNNRGTQHFLQQHIGPMFLDNENNTLWIGHMTGISVWNMVNDSIYYIDRSAGLFSTEIKGIAKDRLGNICVSTPRELSCIHPSYDKERGMTFKIMKFTEKEGIQTEYFVTYAMTANKNGDVFVGGKDGYTLYSPTRSQKTEKDIRIRFSEVAVGDSVLPLLQKDEEDENFIRLNHKDRMISIRFFSGNLVSANRIIYAYRILGLNDGWIYTTENNVKIFSMAPGTYQFEVKAAGETGEWGSVSRLEIYVAPPFYLSWWMITLYIVVALVLLIAIWRDAKRKQEKAMTDLKISMVQQQDIQMSDMKLRFFTNISHDIRTPLTLVVSPLQTLLEEALSDDVHKRLVMIEKNVQILVHQVNKLLDFRRLDVGGEVFTTQSAEIVEITREATKLFKDYAAEKRLQLSFVPIKHSISACIDIEKINKILYNLLSNAVKFTPAGGKITVTVDDDGKDVIFSVADTGIGVSNEDKQKIFQRFFQGKAAQGSGSGIGLHIVSEYVRMHQGKVTVTDNMPMGTLFTVTIPKVETPEKHLAVLDEMAEDMEGTLALQQETSSVYTVLMVENNSDLCNFFADSLRENYRVITAEDGEEALLQLSQHSVSIVVTSVTLPKIDGMELCRRIKTTPKWAHIPVMLITARSADSAVIEGLQHGADDYMVKPFNVESLKKRIESFKEAMEKNHKVFNEAIDINPAELTQTTVDEEFLAKAVRVVEEHLADMEYSVEQLSRDMEMSRVNIFKKLTFLIGRGPNDFIRAIHMKKAYKLLQETDVQVSDAAYALGYSSPKRFSENFKTEFGIKPSDFIRKVRKNAEKKNK